MFNDAETDHRASEVVVVWIGSAWVLLGNVFIDNLDSADLCVGDPGKS